MVVLAGWPAEAAGDGPPAPVPAPPPAPVLDSVTLLSPAPVVLSRTGVAQVPLSCSAGRGCSGAVSLETLKPIRIGARRKSSLGSARFSVSALEATTVGVRLSQREARFARRAGDLKIVTAVEELDLAGRLRRSTIKTKLVARHP
jgi:hypothetical protein